MKNFLCIPLAAFLIALSAPQICHAEVEDGAMIATPVVSRLMSWVERETGIQVPVLPTVVASHTRLWNVLNTQSSHMIGRPQSLFAGGTIIMNNETWDEADPVQMSLLVHELVHYAQSYMRRGWACADAKEVMAYTLQNKWLAQHGQAPFADAAWIERTSACGERGSSPIALAQGKR